ncbi:MAG: AzlC family ABC transporter permease [Firmicutes bacterium]|jgi:4-azaleucine resistance transporter AzlC|nr:AzlC family ABC transporter permease [Bacillota bacterium]
MKRTIDNSDIKRAFRASLPVFAGYIVLGIGFGILLKTKGYGLLWAALSSVFVYAGSLQYVMVNLIAAGAPLITTALTAVMVNARHLFYGISMIDRYKGAGKKKPYLIFALTDETYSLVCSDESVRGVRDRHRYYFFLSMFNQIYWITGSVMGSVLGGLITFSTEGIDFALTALFVTIFVDQWLSTKDHRAALTGVIASVICLLIFGADNFLIPAMLCITAALTVMRSKLSRESIIEDEGGDD